MAFESLSERLNKAFKNISGQGKLTEKNMNDMLKEVRMSLLEADVNYEVVKSFVEKVKKSNLFKNKNNNGHYNGDIVVSFISKNKIEVYPYLTFNFSNEVYRSYNNMFE